MGRSLGPRVSMLTGLPRPVAAAIVIGFSLIAGTAALCDAGILVPQFLNTSSPFGELDQPPGVPSTQIWWESKRNLSWRTWKVTAVEGSEPGGDVVAFLRPTEEPEGALPDRLLAAARRPELTSLPLTVPGRGELIVLRLDSTCQGPPDPDGPYPRRQARVGVETPLGQQWIAYELDPGGCIPPTR